MLAFDVGRWVWSLSFSCGTEILYFHCCSPHSAPRHFDSLIDADCSVPVHVDARSLRQSFINPEHCPIQSSGLSGNTIFGFVNCNALSMDIAGRKLWVMIHGRKRNTTRPGAMDHDQHFLLCTSVPQDRSQKLHSAIVFRRQDARSYNSRVDPDYL